jgi:hypothetical protein
VRRDAALIALLATAIVVALHVRGLPGSFLSDDFGHLATIALLDRDGKLGAWLAERFVDQLHNGNFAYRPILFISYAIDWRAFGASAAPAHVENLVLHLADAALVGALAFRWSKQRAWTAAAVAMAAFAAYPLTGEVSFWVVGRANLLAALFGLLLLLSIADAPRAHASPSRHVARVACLYAALLSNESAMPLPVLATFVVAFGRPLGARGLVGLVVSRVLAALRELAPVWIAFAVYLAWRTRLFGAPFMVYTGMPTPTRAGEWIERLGVLVESFGQQAAMHPPLLWPIVFAALALLLAIAVARSTATAPSTAAIVAFAIAAIVYVLAAAASVVPARHGEGARNYYLPWIFAACAIGMAAARSNAARACALAVVGWLLVGQEGSLRQWQSAAASMRALTAAVPRLASSIDRRQYAAVFLPDRIGAVLFARNAQGAIFMWPVQRVDYVQRMAGMTERDVDHWPALLANHGFDALHGGPLAIEDFVGVYCFNGARSEFARIAGGGAVPPADWGRTLRDDAARAGCLPMR